MLKLIQHILMAVVVLSCLPMLAFAQEPAPPGTYALSGSLGTSTAEILSDDRHELILYPALGGASDDGVEFWRFGLTSEGSAPLSAVARRPLGPVGTFRSGPEASSSYFLFPAPGSAKKVQAAYARLVSREGSYSGAAGLSLGVFGANGVKLRSASASDLDLTTVSGASWNSIALSASDDDLVVSPGQFLAFVATFEGDASGDLDVQLGFEVQVVDTSGPPPPPRADLALSKTVVPAVVTPGDPITYTLTYTNYGPYPASGVWVSDALASMVTHATFTYTGSSITPTLGEQFAWQVDDLDYYEGGIITVAGRIDSMLAADTWLTNTAVISSSTTDLNSGNNTGHAVSEVRVIPKLALTKTAEPSTGVAYHGEVTYTLCISNWAIVDAPSTVLTDVLPAEVDFARWVQTQDGTTAEDDGIRWVGTVTAGQAMTWTFVVTHTGGYNDEVTNTAFYTQPYGNGSAAATFDVVGSDLSLSKAVEPASGVTYHGEVTYTLVLSNSGSVDAPAVWLTDTIPVKAAFARWVESHGAAQVGSQITWNGPISTGAALTVSFVAQHTGDYGDVVPNGALFDCPVMRQGGSALAEFDVLGPPELSLRKTVTPSVDVPISGEVTYTLALANDGPSDAITVRLTDTIPYPYLQFSRWVEQHDATQHMAVADQIQWNGTVLAGEGVTVSFVAAPWYSGSYGQVVTNTAQASDSASGQQFAAEAGFNREDQLLLSLDKQANHTRIGCGDEVTYTLNLSNPLDKDVTTQLTDTLPAALVFSRWVQSPGGTVVNGDEIEWSGTVTPDQTLEWEYVASHVGACAGTVVNSAAYQTSNGSGVASATVEIGEPPFVLTKSVEPSEDVRYHSTVTYTILLSSTEATEIREIGLDDTLPSEATFGSWIESPSDTSVTDEGVDWEGNLLAGEVLTWTFVATHTGHATEVVTNTVVVWRGKDEYVARAEYSAVVGPLYLPLIYNGFSLAPDLVARIDTVTTNRVVVVVTNQGNRPARDDFWVDLYFDPRVTPPRINQPWSSVASHGATWGVTADLQPGASLTLTNEASDPYYFSDISSPTPFPTSSAVYVYADSVDFTTTYGAILESDESNNTAGPAHTTASAGAVVEASTGQKARSSTLPRR